MPHTSSRDSYHRSSCNRQESCTSCQSLRTRMSHTSVHQGQVALQLCPEWYMRWCNKRENPRAACPSYQPLFKLCTHPPTCPPTCPPQSQSLRCLPLRNCDLARLLEFICPFRQWHTVWQQGEISLTAAITSQPCLAVHPQSHQMMIWHVCIRKKSSRVTKNVAPWQLHM